MKESPRERLQKLLRELFQFDSADLDFGIYRIMNLRRKEIERFIEKDLLGAVAKGFELIKKGEQKDVADEVEAFSRQILESFGKDSLDAAGKVSEAFRSTPLGKQYQEKRKLLADVKITDESWHRK